MEDPRARKRALRKRVVEQILAMDPADRRRQEKGLTARFADLPGFAEAPTVLLYASAFPEEFTTSPLLRIALAAGKRLACPRVNRARECLEIVEVTDLDGDFEAGMKGIPEPRQNCPVLDAKAVDWVLVPGLAFDSSGFRLGRGRGHYDRLLPTLRPEVARWALALDPQWVEVLPVEPHDQPLDGVAGVDRVVEGVGRRSRGL